MGDSSDPSTSTVKLAVEQRAIYTGFMSSIDKREVSEMNASEWVARCSARLHAQWPRLHRDQRDEVASELLHDSRWQHLEPEQAAVDWLRQGIPGDEKRDAG